jgi:hypothetical protein
MTYFDQIAFKLAKWNNPQKKLSELAELFKSNIDAGISVDIVDEARMFKDLNLTVEKVNEQSMFQHPYNKNKDLSLLEYCRDDSRIHVMTNFERLYPAAQISADYRSRALPS